MVLYAVGFAALMAALVALLSRLLGLRAAWPGAVVAFVLFLVGSLR